MQRVFTAAFPCNILKHDLIPLEHRESTAFKVRDQTNSRREYGTEWGKWSGQRENCNTKQNILQKIKG